MTACLGTAVQDIYRVGATAQHQLKGSSDRLPLPTRIRLRMMEGASHEARHQQEQEQ